MRTRARNAASLALASRTSSRSVPSPTTGYRARRTVSSGCSTAAWASAKRIPSLPRTRLRSAISSPSTRFSARALTRCTTPRNSSTRLSVISVWRRAHRAASSVRRTGAGCARIHAGYSAPARARHARSRFSEVSANRSTGKPSARTRSSLAISASSVSSPSRPESAFSSASRPGPPPTAMRSSSPARRVTGSSPATSPSSLAIVSAERRATVAAQKRSSASLRAAPRMRSRRPGGSMRSSRQRPSNASRWRSSSGSPGHTSSASRPDSRSSSARLASRKPSAVRICAR